MSGILILSQDKCNIILCKNIYIFAYPQKDKGYIIKEYLTEDESITLGKYKDFDTAKKIIKIMFDCNVFEMPADKD